MWPPCGGGGPEDDLWDSMTGVPDGDLLPCRSVRVLHAAESGPGVREGSSGVGATGLSGGGGASRGVGAQASHVLLRLTLF